MEADLGQLHAEYVSVTPPPIRPAFIALEAGE